MVSCNGVFLTLFPLGEAGITRRRLHLLLQLEFSWFLNKY